jgi:hypothetical protein
VTAKSSASYQRRNARARALGYESYYHQRIAAGAPPEAPKPRGEQLRRRRGHVGPEDLVGFIRRGDLILMPSGISSVESFIRTTTRSVWVTRKSTGKRHRRMIVRRVQVYREVEKLVQPPPGSRRASRWFMLRNITRPDLVRLIERERAKGAEWAQAPSQDQRRIVSREEDEDGY